MVKALCLMLKECCRERIFQKKHLRGKTEALQPVELSGTIKRVGLDHLWTRL